MSRGGYVAAGAAIGLLTAFGSGALFGVIAGAVVAWILFEQERLGRRLGRLEGRSSLRREGQRPDRVGATEAEDAGTGEDVSGTPAPAAAPDRPADRLDRMPERPAERTPRPAAVPPFPSRGTTPATAVPAAALRRWLTTGNLPVKVGVIVSFFGVAFLLKYAVDRDLITVPMSLRLALAALAGLVLWLLGWRLRRRMRGYALSLQGGGVGIVYLTVFAAFRLYGLLAPLPAFALLAAITVTAAALAVVQNSKTMVLLAVTGGFLAPLLVSTGPGSHVALFGYYLLLNLAVVGIAWFRSWRELNLAGFLFTFAVGSFWGVQYYRPANFASVEPFLIAHFLIYQAAVVLFAFRQPPRLRGIVDGTLLFGTPVVVFALQAALLRDSEYGLAVSAAALTAFYAAAGAWLRGHGPRLRLLSDAFFALAVAFAIVAVPLAFDARWTASTWAAQGAALVWLGTRQGGRWTRLSGIALIAAAGAAFALGGWQSSAGMAVLNANVLGGALLSGAGLFAARQLEPAGPRWRIAAYALLAWGIAWWLATGFFEIDDRARHLREYPIGVAFLAASSALLSLAGRRLHWRSARLAALVLLPCLAALLAGRAATGGHPLQAGAAVPWLLAGAAHLYILAGLPQTPRVAGSWHVAGVLLAAVVAAWEIHWWVVVTTWRNAAICAALLGIAAVCLAGRRIVRWPLRAERAAYTAAGGLLIGATLAFLVPVGVATPGNPLPWPYLPVFNPYDVVSLAALGAAAWWTTRYAADLKAGGSARILWPVVGLAMLSLGTLAVIRGVHHVAGVPWTLTAMGGAVTVQAALSIFWGAAAFAAMLLGTQRRSRGLWLSGAALMALVVLKLFLVDLGNSGTVARIVSFVGVGVLLLVVGYFSPAPPRAGAINGVAR